MKLVLLFVFLTTSQLILEGQTAEEILWKTEGSYRRLTNYVDEGTQIRISSAFPFPDTTDYAIAMDKEGNVYHWFYKDFIGNTHGAKYVKTAHDSSGMYTRLGTEDASFTCGMQEAGARLMGSGGSMFSLLGSLFYPGYTSVTPYSSSMIQYYDTAKRLDDTTINEAICFVIKTRKTIIIPQEFADKENFKRDSVQGLLTLPPEQRSGPRTEAGPKTSERKYYIRQSDLMLIRVEDYHIKDSTDIVKYKSILVLHPMYDVSDFDNYLKE